MKIRTGFVSNSSSSSFCIVGINANFDSITEFIKQNESKIVEEYGSFDEEEENWEYFHFLVSNSPLEHKVSWESEEYYIGLSFNDMEDDETLLQFKERVAKHLTDETGKNYVASEMKILSGTIYN